MDQTADEPVGRPPDPARPASALATVRASLRLLDARDRRRYRFALLAQVLLAGLDLLGVLLLGLVGLVTTAAATNTPPPQALTAVVATAGLQQTPMTTIAIGLGVAAGALLTGKGLLALLIQRRVALFLSERVAGLSRQLAGAFLSQSLPEIHHRPRQWVAHAFVDGLTHAVIGVLDYALIAVGDIAVLAALGATLLFVDPVTTSITVAYFAAATHVTNRWLATWAHRVGSVATSSAIGSRAAILDAVATYREAVAGGRREFFVDRFAQLRASNARTQADAATLLTVPRFTMEIALVPGAAILIAVLVVTGGSPAEVVGSMALFLAAIARAMPSLIRLNSGLIGIRTTGSEAAATLELWEQVPRRPAAAAPATAPAGQARGPLPVVVDAVTLHYPGSRDPALDSVSLTVPAGRSLALVGPSGAGKSSLVDVLLGVATPSAGTALIAGLPAPALVAQRPGALAYVPQDVAIIHGTVRDNVALGLTGVDDADVWTALDRAHLGEFVRAQPETLDTAVGDQGVRLSGGQRQRLGLARALLTAPSVLVLDEATSALDAETERAIADTIAALGTAVTTITVAHRLATIRSADIVAYLERGRLVAAGSFADVRAAVPSFERQARLLGL